MKEILNFLREIFFTKIIADIDLYTIISSIFKFIFVYIVLYYIYIVVKLIILDIKNIENNTNEIVKSYIVFNQDGEEKKYLLENKTSIGRSKNNDIVLNDKTISKNHASIVESDGSYYLVDQNSSNGTFLNDNLIESNLELFDQDLISIGGYQIRFVVEKENI